ncbi:hypothetical protein ACFR9U_08445 [Halorientalis brevis]|uniref:Uncharacterized protein n=1 Tax=Halorientalis brevis TaxID=1126241 RepID=A0ABD6CBC0_9EURY|nr:hypothetical protein [Halorientalis brevis]
MAEGAVLILVLLLAVAGPFVLYALIQSETDDVPTMDRTEAERTARRDSDEGRDGDVGWDDRNGRRR